jgi:hypothetical protein
MMGKKVLAIGGVVLAGVLMLGAVAVWLVPGKAEAAYGRQAGSEAACSERQGAGRGQAGNARTAMANEQPASSNQGAGRGSGQAAGQGQDNAAYNPALIGDEDYGVLSESEAEALLMALDDEYKAWAVYDQVIADFGAVRPFTSIRQAEENHIAALEALLDRYGLEMPANEYPGNVPTFDTLSEACAAGVQAEIDNAGLYDQLFQMVDNPDIIQVFTNLQQASETKHLPAFERCAQ